VENGRPEVKLLKREDEHFIFLVGKRQREMMFALLRRYPVVISGHFRQRHPAKSGEAKANQELLEEALAEQQKENRRALEQMLNQPDRFQESDLGFTFSVTEPEIEWLLQVFNDIRVGSWIQLGEPDPDSAASLQASEQNVQLAWAMEMAGLFEHSLLKAVGAGD
jgi:hypothetical protein